MQRRPQWWHGWPQGFCRGDSTGLLTPLIIRSGVMPGGRLYWPTHPSDNSFWGDSRLPYHHLILTGFRDDELAVVEHTVNVILVYFAVSKHR